MGRDVHDWAASLVKRLIERLRAYHPTFTTACIATRGQRVGDIFIDRGDKNIAGFESITLELPAEE